LIVEVDGSVHNNSDQAEYDQFRTTDLAQIGIKVLRFTNNEVLKELEKVLKQINDFLTTHSTILAK
jgi:cyclase